MNARLTQILGGLLQSDLALRLVQNEALMKAMLKAFSVSVEARQVVEAQLQGLMKGLDLARRDDIDALRREIGGLRNVVADLESRLEDALDRIELLSAGEGDDFLPRAGLDNASPYARSSLFGAEGSAYADDESPYAELYDDELGEDAPAAPAEAPKAPAAKKPAAEKPAAPKKPAVEAPATAQAPAAAVKPAPKKPAAKKPAAPKAPAESAEPTPAAPTPARPRRKRTAE